MFALLKSVNVHEHIIHHLKYDIGVEKISNKKNLMLFLSFLLIRELTLGQHSLYYMSNNIYIS